MAGTLIAYAPLVACPLGMAAMMGIPALVCRARRRRLNGGASGPEETANRGTPSDVGRDPSDELPGLPIARSEAPQHDVLAGSVPASN